MSDRYPATLSIGKTRPDASYRFSMVPPMLHPEVRKDWENLNRVSFVSCVRFAELDCTRTAELIYSKEAPSQSGASPGPMRGFAGERLRKQTARQPPKFAYRFHATRLSLGRSLHSLPAEHRQHTGFQPHKTQRGHIVVLARCATEIGV